MFLAKKIGILVLGTAVLCGVCSCKSDIKIKAKKDSCSITYGTVLGNALRDTVSAFSGGEEVAFDPSQFEEIFSESNLKNVSAKSETKDSIFLSADLDEEKLDFISKSNILSVGANGSSVTLTFSEENLSAMYESMPQTMQAYIDMFMAPSFSGEKMTDEEYLELVSSVYGDFVSDEIKKSVINFTLVNSRGKSTTYEVKLLDIINMKKELVLKI